MKIFNVSVCVEINQIGEFTEREPETPGPGWPTAKPNDDLLDRAGKMLDRLGSTQVNLGYGAIGDSTRMVENVRITAESFEDLQAILHKFHATAKQLTPVPESIVRQASNLG